MTKKVFTLLILFLVLVLTGCGDDDWTDKGSVKSNKEGFSLSYTIPGAITAVTRATVPNEQGEDRVNSLYILFFENRANGNGEFVEAIDAMAAYTASLGSSGTLEIELTSPLKHSAEYKMLFCANIDEYSVVSFSGMDGLKAICQGQTESEVTSMLLEVSATEPLRSDNLPMSATAVKAAGQKNISIELIRVVSRFDVYSFVNGYDLVSASIWNAYPVSRIWNTSMGNYSEERIDFFYGVEADDNKVVGGLYAFENYVESPFRNDEATTCLILGLKKDGLDEVRYFRANIHPTDMGQKLTRNNVYNTSVMGVKGEGEETLYDAYMSSTSNLEIDINGWTLDSDGNVQYDGENMLVIPTSLITLFPEGETRVYNVYSVSETEVLQMTDNLPSGITASFVKSILDDYTYTLTISANESSVDRAGTLSFTLGSLTAQIRIMQAKQETVTYLNTDADELLTFSSLKGEISEPITVISSGSWVATIYNGTNFSFGTGTSQVTQIEGEPGEHFNIHTILANQSQEILLSFVIVKLKDNPDVSRAIMLEQQVKEELFIRFNPEGMSVNARKHTLTSITLESNAEWDLYVGLNANSVPISFTNDNNQQVQTLSGEGYKRLTINIGDNPANIRSSIYIQAKIKGTNKTASLHLNQYKGNEVQPPTIPDPEKGMIFVSNGTGAGNLVSTNTNGYRWYVYGLGENMRNSTKFGNGGKIADIGKDAFEYTGTFNASTIADAKIIQLLTTPSAANFDRIYKNMQADPTAFLMITSTDPTVVNSILKMFKDKTGAAYGSAVNISNSPSNLRPFNKAVTHPLMNYLLDGPGGKITNALQITLQSSVGQVGAALPPAAYPSTFVPIIRSNSNNDYCVFGIDPVHRVIIMTDPGIFGAAPNLTAYPSYKNFLHAGTVNSIFLDNLTAWIINATGKTGFLRNYQ